MSDDDFWIQTPRNMRRQKEDKEKEYEKLLLDTENEMKFNNRASLIAFPLELIGCALVLQHTGSVAYIPILSYYFHHSYNKKKEELEIIKRNARRFI